MVIMKLMCTSMLSGVQLFKTPWTPQSMGFSRQEYSGGLPFPPPEDLPDPGKIKPTSPESPALADRFFTTATPRKPMKLVNNA